MSSTSRMCAVVEGSLPGAWSSAAPCAGSWVQGSLLGLLRTAAQERPRHAMATLDVDANLPGVLSPRVVSGLLDDLETAVRQGVWMQRKLLHARVSQSSSLVQLTPSPRGSP